MTPPDAQLYTNPALRETLTEISTTRSAEDAP